KPKPPLVVQTPTPSPTPKPPTTTTPCPPCPKLIPDLCASLPLLGIKQQRRESCKSALLRHLNEFRGRIDCASLGVSPLPGETCSNAIIRHFTEQANCTRMAALQIQKQDNETCAAAIDRHVKELMKRADCDKLLSLGITPKPNENCETMLRRYLEDGKNISLDFKVKQNTGTGSVPFSKVVAEKYADKLSIPILPKPSEQKIEILDSVNTKNLIKLMSDEIADYEAKMEEARTAKVEVYFIANETGRRKKGEKDVRIHLTKDGLTKKEFKKFKSPRVKNIYVMLPLKPVLFPEKSQIPFKIMIQDIVLPETKHLESNPQVIKELYKQVAVGRGFAIPKNSIAKKTDNYSNVPLFIVTYYGEQNLISNANSVSPDKKNEKAYEFYINKHGFYTGKVE
ncbi:MAG TPA: hypothetical protein PK715_05995, partial [Chitinophagales bacterium]|nr:hypothetical protein [Chitinophagales bacterium]